MNYNGCVVTRYFPDVIAMDKHASKTFELFEGECKITYEYIKLPDMRHDYDSCDNDDDSDNQSVCSSHFDFDADLGDCECDNEREDDRCAFCSRRCECRGCKDFDSEYTQEVIEWTYDNGLDGEPPVDSEILETFKPNDLDYMESLDGN